MVEVTLHLEAGLEPCGIKTLALVAPEFLVHRNGGEVSDVPDHARIGEPPVGTFLLVVVIPAVEVRVVHDHLAPDHFEPERLRRQARRRRNAQALAQLARITHRPLQGLHPAHAPADHRLQHVDAEKLQQQTLCVHHVLDRDLRKRGPVGFTRVGVDGRRAGGALAAAKHVLRDHEIPLRVDRLARADHLVPPAGLAVILGMPPCSVRVGGQWRTNENRVRLVVVEFAVGFIGDFKSLQRLARHQLKPLRRKGDVGHAGLNPHFLRIGSFCHESGQI